MTKQDILNEDKIFLLRQDGALWKLAKSAGNSWDLFHNGKFGWRWHDNISESSVLKYAAESSILVECFLEQ